MIRKSSVIKISLSFAVAITLVIYLWLVSTRPVDSVLVPAKSKMADQPVPDFSQTQSIKQKKQRFFAYLEPEIIQQNQHLLGIRHELQMMIRKQQRGETLSNREQEKIKWLAAEYRVELVKKDNQAVISEAVIQALLHKIDVIPVELVLVQAANESAWGTSRFAQEGYNFFGLWCFVEGCGFVPSRRDESSSHEVAKFENLTDAVYTYLRNLNRHDAYNELRNIRAQLRDNQTSITGNELAEGLVNYSERGHDYVEEIQTMIRINREYFTE